MKVSHYWDEYRKNLEAASDEAPSFRDFLNGVKADRVSSTGAGEAMMAESVESDEDDLNDALEIVRDASIESPIRIRALEGISYEIGKDDNGIELVLTLLGDENESLDLRQAALGVLKQLNFTSAIFRSHISEYTDTLRTILGEEDSLLRQQAIEVLSRFKDEYLQRLLVAGLEGEEKALVPPEKAIQLLGYDIHAGIFPMLRDILKDPPSAVAKNEAMRILAADSESKDLIRETLLDKDEDRYVRQTSAAALSSLAPEEFEDIAKKIVLDDNEYDDIRATSLTILEHSTPTPPEGSGVEELLASGFARSAGDALTAKVEDLSDNSTGDLKKVADRYLSKLGRRSR